MSLQGTLSTLGITDVLEFMAERSFTGQLDITTESGTASYLLVDGDVGMAEFEFVRGSGTDPAEATYYVLAEVDGEFFFEEQDVTADDDGEKVEDLLGRTVGIADKWAEVEEEIPSTSHILARNSKLDASVTIEPGWWQVLEVVGTEQTTMQLSKALDLGILESSEQALSMVKAGLLVVTDEVAETEPAPTAIATEDVAAVGHPAPEQIAPEQVASEQITPDQAPDVNPEDAPAPPILISSEPAPVVETDAFEATGAFDEVPSTNDVPAAEEATAAVEDVPALEEVAIAEMPVPEEQAPAVDEPAAAAAPALGFTENFDDSADDLSVPAFDDDGWSTNPFVGSAAPVPEGTGSAVEEVPMADEVLPEVPVEESIAPISFEQPDYLASETDEAPAPLAAPGDLYPPMELEETASFDPTSFDASAPFGEGSPAAAFDATGLEPVPEAEAGVIGMDASFGEPLPDVAPADSATDDLGFLNDDLDSDFGLPAPDAQAPAQASPVADIPAADAAPLGETDPFGSLSDLVVDEEPEAERGSVLKFLRRD